MKMRCLLAILLLSATPAVGQESLGETLCLATPTFDCALDLTVAATRKAEPLTTENLPWRRIIETASRGGRVDMALALADRLTESDSSEATDLAEALTRAGRADELVPVLARINKKPQDFAFAIAPVLVELQRDAELDAFSKSIQPPAPAFQVDYWHVLGDARAGRVEAAKKRLASVTEADRASIAALVVETLYYGKEAETAKPFLDQVPNDRTYLICGIAEALRDRQLAARCAEALETAKPEDVDFLRSNVITALAAAGEWQRAVTLAEQQIPNERALSYVNIMVYSRDPKFLPVLSSKMIQDPGSFSGGNIKNLMVRALVLSGLEPMSRQIIDSAGSAEDRESMATFAAAAMADIGQPQEALLQAISMPDQRRKAWALWEVASKIAP